jgi:hypothetical protein
MKRVALVVAGILVAVVAMLWMRREARDAVPPVATPDASVPGVDAPRRSVGPSPAIRDAMRQPAQPRSTLVVAFRLDPNVTRGLFLGDRWVSPPTFAFAQPGDRYVVHARAQPGEDSEDVIAAQWATTDPDMIAITPEPGGAVTIAVERPGTAELRVTARGESKILQVAARKHPDAMEVEFRQ